MVTEIQAVERLDGVRDARGRCAYKVWAWVQQGITRYPIAPTLYADDAEDAEFRCRTTRWIPERLNA